MSDLHKSKTAETPDDDPRDSTDTSKGKCAYCRGKIIAKEPRKTDDGLCCWQCWQRIE